MCFYPLMCFSEKTTRSLILTRRYTRLVAALLYDRQNGDQIGQNHDEQSSDDRQDNDCGNHRRP